MDLIGSFEKFKAKSDDPKTHTIIPNKNNKEYKFGATYSLDKSKYEGFAKFFNKYFFNKGGTLSVTETIPEITPFYIDIDLNYTGISTDKQYTDETVDLLVKYLFKIMSEYFVIEDISKIKCFVQEKAESKKNDEGMVIKEGLHILFPDIIGDKLVFNELLRIISNDPEADKIFDSCHNRPSNPLNKIFDTNVSRWFIYGSYKPDGIPYLVTKIYEYTTLIECNYTSLHFSHMFYLTKDHTKNIEYKNDIDNIFEEITLYKSSSNMSLNILDGIDINEEDFVDEEEQDEFIEAVIYLKENEIKLVHNFVLECLSTNRIEEYDLWIRLAMCLKNILGDNGLDLFIKFSERGETHRSSPEECIKYWKDLNKNGAGYTYGSLKYWANEDNAGKYNYILDQSVTNLIHRSVVDGGAHDDVANVVHMRFKDEYLCADFKSNLWYHFTGTLWKPCKNGYLLQMELTSRIKNMYRRKMDEEHRLQIDDEENKDTHEKREDACYKIYFNLRNIPFQKNIMESCKNKFYQGDFHETMDSNTKLLCFNNCVFDLSECILREGRPEDKLTISTEYELPILPKELPMKIDELWSKIEQREGIVKKKWDQCTTTSPMFRKRSKNIKRFLLKILPDLPDIEENPGEIRKHCLKYIASRLCGDTSARFSIFTGGGGNGKSILIDLIRKAMGEYCKNVPVTLLTQKRKSSNAACPEKARTRGARFVYLQEPDENETINAGEMKELSGGDSILARNLFQDPFEFKPQFEMVLMCNDKPKIKDKTQGAWRRVVVFPFNSRFVDRDCEVNEVNHVYKADKLLQNTIADWGVIFMGILLCQWCTGDCVYTEIPKSIRLETDNYRYQNDIIGQWLSDSIVETKEETCSFRDLCDGFDTWVEEVWGKSHKVDRISFKERLINWQKNKYGWDEAINGSFTNPRINMTFKD